MFKKVEITAGEYRWQLAVLPEVSVVIFVVHLHNRLPFLGVPVYKETITPFRWPNATRSSISWFTTIRCGVKMVICHYSSSAASMAKISTSLRSHNVFCKHQSVSISEGKHTQLHAHLRWVRFYLGMIKWRAHCCEDVFLASSSAHRLTDSRLNWNIKFKWYLSTGSQ